MNINIDIEKLKYLLNNVENNIGILIDNVLSDSKTDPHYSAVTASNRIKCYIQIMHELGESLPYNDIEGFFEFNAYTKKEYLEFEKLRREESTYYLGIQY